MTNTAKLLTVALFVIFSMLTSMARAEIIEYEAFIIKVIDGDTVKVSVPAWPEIFRVQNVRIFGVDTPEKGYRAKCPYEAEKGDAATNGLKNVLHKGNTVVLLYDTKIHDKYGRVLADLRFMVDGNPALVSEWLIGNGLAREYDGGKKSDWCE